MFHHELLIDTSKTPENISEVLLKIANCNLETLLTSERTTKGATVSFDKVKVNVFELQRYFKNVSAHRLELLPSRLFYDLLDELKGLFEFIDLINFPGGNDLVESKDIIERDINNIYHSERKDKIWRIICDSITLENAEKQDSLELSQLSNRLQSDLYEIEAKRLLDSIQVLHKASQDEAAKIGVQKHAGLFHNQAKKHEEQSSYWLGFLVILLICDGALITNLILEITRKDLGAISRIQTSIISVGIITLVSYVVSLCVRNYYAEKHNQSINEHRANCLGSYNTFVESADAESKKAILLQATNTIFTNQKTGYLGKDSESLNPSSMFDIVQKIMEAQKTGKL